MTSPEELKASFERVWPWLEVALRDFGDTHTKEQIWEEIATERAQLWTTENAAILTSIEKWPKGVTELLWWLAGGDLEEILSIQPFIEQWAIGKGVDRFVITGRKGWERKLPDYRLASCNYVKEVRNG